MTYLPNYLYRLGTISNIKFLNFLGGGGGLNRFYRRLTSPSSSAVTVIYTNINKQLENQVMNYSEHLIEFKIYVNTEWICFMNTSISAQSKTESVPFSGCLRVLQTQQHSKIVFFFLIFRPLPVSY